MAQLVIPAAQLVPKYHIIGRCNNYAVLQSIPCSPECKIVGQILLDHPLSYTLTATADVPNVQQFVYTVDMFRDILHFPVETPKNLFVAPVNIETIETFINKAGYQGVVDKVSAFYTKNLAQPWQTIFKVFNRCLTTRTSRHDQTKINILQLFHAVINRTNVDYVALLWWDFKSNVVVLMNQPQLVVSTQGMHRSTPRAHMTHTLIASPQGKNRKQSEGESSTPQKSLKITIRQQKVVEQEKDDDDSENRLEPESHKDNPETVDDDADNYVEKVDEEEIGEMGSLETRTEETQTTIPTPPRSPRILLSSDKNIS
ncbi:hypothetical protein Tco_0126801 [Tanacetum coccineum]